MAGLPMAAALALGLALGLAGCAADGPRTSLHDVPPVVQPAVSLETREFQLDALKLERDTIAEETARIRREQDLERGLYAEMDAAAAQ